MTQCSCKACSARRVEEMGEVIEAALEDARRNLGILPDWLPESLKESALCTTLATNIVFNDRSRAYGPPRDNHLRTAALWSAYINARKHPMDPLTPTDVCAMNILQKLARQLENPKDDNWVDICGYALNGQVCDHLEAQT